MTDISKPGEAENEESTLIAVDFALVVSRMLDTVRNDPAQLRAAVYELARAKLADQLMTSHSTERKQVRAALEIAIQGVEQFSQRKDDLETKKLARDHTAIPSPTSSGSERLDEAPRALTIPDAPEPAYSRIAPPPQPYDFEKPEPKTTRRSRSFSMLLRLGVLVIVAVTILGIVALRKNEKFGLANLSFPNLSFPKLSIAQTGSTTQTTPPPAPAPAPIRSIAAPKSEAAAPQPPAATAAIAPSAVLPTSFGVYAVANEKLFSLESLPGRVPDQRVAISGEIRHPPTTSLPDGRIKFIVYRREVAGTAPEKAEIRFIARIVRAMKFEGGKPMANTSDDAWAIRNISIPLRIAPVKENAEMYEIRSEEPDFNLGPGRYALVVKGIAYDFQIPGQISDPRQCLELTQAANGNFYSECRKP